MGLYLQNSASSKLLKDLCLKFIPFLNPLLQETQPKRNDKIKNCKATELSQKTRLYFRREKVLKMPFPRTSTGVSTVLPKNPIKPRPPPNKKS